MFRQIALKLFTQIENTVRASKDDEQAIKGLRKALVHFHGSIPRPTEIEKNHIKWTLKVQVDGATYYSHEYIINHMIPFATTAERNWKSTVQKDHFMPLAKKMIPIELHVTVGDAEYRYDIFDMKVLDEQ